MSFEIITDSTCDLALEYRQKYNILYAPMNFSINNKESVADLDWAEISSHDYYEIMRKGERVLTTQVPEHVFYEMFKQVLDNGNDVLYLACSSKLSGSINIARSVSNELKSQYPKCKIICIDTLRSTLGEGLIVLKAAVLRDEGKTIDEVAAFIEEKKLNFHTIATVENLNYLKKAGRVKASSAFFGNIFAVKPIIIADASGANYALKKVKGRKSSLLELVRMMEEDIINPQEQIIAIEHADCMEDLEFLKNEIVQKFNPKDIIIAPVGPIIGATVGPGTIIVSFFGRKESIIGVE